MKRDLFSDNKMYILKCLLSVRLFLLHTHILACLVSSTYSLISYSLRHRSGFNQSLSTFAPFHPLSRAHFQQSNLISRHEVYACVLVRTLNTLNIPLDGPSHGLAVKSSRWVYKWEVAEVRSLLSTALSMYLSVGDYQKITIHAHTHTHTCIHTVYKCEFQPTLLYFIPIHIDMLFKAKMNPGTLF